MGKRLASVMVMMMLLFTVFSSVAWAEKKAAGSPDPAAAPAAAAPPGDEVQEKENRSVDNRIEEAISKYLQQAPVQRSTVYNVRDAEFGAIGDGVADDTAAIQKALDRARDDGGGIVLLQPGTYRTSENLYVYSRTKVLGNQAKIAKADGDELYSVLEVAADQSDVVIEGLWLENNKLSGCIGVDLAANVTRVWIENNKFTGVNAQAVNINSMGVRHVQVSGNHFEEVAYGVLTNFLAKDVNDVRVINNQFVHIHGDAVELNHPGSAYEAGHNMVVAGNYINVPEGYGSSDGAGLGIGVAGATHVTIMGNVIENARYEAIHIEDEAKHISIIGNIINGVQNVPAVNLNSGIYVLDGDYITISGNTVDNAQDYGIHLEYAPDNQATHTIITGNTITRSKEGGIRVAGYSGNSDIIVSDNVVTTNFGNGIHIGGDIRQLKVTDNIVRDNTGYGLFLEESGLDWYLSGNSLFGNTAGDIGVGSGFKIPVPLRNNGSVFGVNAQVVPGDVATHYTAWTDAFTLGIGAEGYLYASARLGDARSTKIYKVTWNGTEFKAVQLVHDIEGGLEIDTPRMNGNKLQVQAYTLTSGTVIFDVQFEGMALLK